MSIESPTALTVNCLCNTRVKGATYNDYIFSSIWLSGISRSVICPVYSKPIGILILRRNRTEIIIGEVVPLLVTLLALASTQYARSTYCSSIAIPIEDMRSKKLGP